MHKKQKKIGGGDMAAIINKMLNFVGFDTDEDFMDENSEVYEMGENVGKSKNEVVGSNSEYSIIESKDSDNKIRPYDEIIIQSKN